jgi:S-DNA-T family DNA segregation ATPase FtsK/SpoIIIE
VEIGPPTTLVLPREPGRNVLIVAPNEMTGGLLAGCVASVAASVSSAGNPAILYFDGGRSDDLMLGTWLNECGIASEVIKPRECDERIVQLSKLVQNRTEADDREQPPTLVIIDPLERFRDLRQDESFSFSLDGAAGGVSGAEALQKVLRDGPAVGVFTVLACSSAETLTRWLPRASRHDLQQRILGRINPSDSSALIDSPDAANLSAATMLIYDDADGSTRKFRVCDLPDSTLIRTWLESRSKASLA